MSSPATIVIAGLLIANLIMTMATHGQMRDTKRAVNDARESAEQAASYATECSQDLERSLGL